MKYKAKKGYKDMEKNLASEGSYQKHMMLLNGSEIEILDLPKGWDKFLDPVSKNSKSKEGDK